MITRFKKLWPHIVLSLLTLVVWSLMLNRQSGEHDFVTHGRVVREIFEQKLIKAIHILYHVLSGILSIVLQIGPVKAGVIILVVACIITANILYRQMFIRMGTSAFAGILLTMSLMVVTPIQLFYFVDEHLYAGYIGITTYHNPTIILLAPFALSLFIVTTDMFCGEKSLGIGKGNLLFLLAFLVVGSALAKPTYLVCFLPAVILFVFFMRTQRQEVDWLLVLIGLILPAILVLGVQYWFTYTQAQVESLYGGSQSTLVIAPFKIMGLWSEWLGLKFLLSILFPLSVAFVSRKSLKCDLSLLFAWFTFAIGAFWAYFLAEDGPRMRHGNLLWGAYTCLFLLFFASLRHLYVYVGPDEKARWSSVRFVLPMIVFIMHVISGICYYLGEYYDPELFW